MPCGPGDPPIRQPCRRARVCIGVKTSRGTDDFAVRVATPAGLALDDTVGVIAKRVEKLRRFLDWEYDGPSK
jgi:hypothetical protein